MARTTAMQFGQQCSMVWLCAALLFAAEGARSAEEESSPVGSPQTIFLAYHETDYICNGNWSLGVDWVFSPFKKEPELGKAKVHRGRLFGKAKGMATAFIWSPSEGKLYLDLNRNEDLTDDAKGVHSKNPKGGSMQGMQAFTDVRLESTSGETKRQYKVELNFRQYGNSGGAFMGAKSLWEGKFVADGQEWQVGILEALAERAETPSALLCRPWKDRTLPFNMQRGSLDAFTLPSRIFFGNKGYSVSWRYGQQGGKSGYLLELKELQPKIGEVKLSGKFLKRVLLVSSTGYTVLLDNPEPVAKLPAGTYTHYRASLEAGGTKALVNQNNRVERSFVVDQGSSVNLVVGGPLTNRVTVNRRGKHLGLGYSLHGADGSEYQLETPGDPVAPQFAIYQGNKKIASGSFQFG